MQYCCDVFQLYVNTASLLLRETSCCTAAPTIASLQICVDVYFLLI